jgi:hypothetical protein
LKAIKEMKNDEFLLLQMKDAMENRWCVCGGLYGAAHSYRALNMPGSTVSKDLSRLY